MEEDNSGKCGKYETGIFCSRRNIVSFEGVPTHCWCGNRVTTFVSKTRTNPFRRFYRCVVARQREGEAHLFRWVDDALVDEVSLVAARQRNVEGEIEVLVKSVKNVVVDRDNNGCLSVLTWLCSKFR
ncbi:hypothetical protein Bca4012_019675 [Brassica carinata]|uniref:GRF-type domain-containing protein n=1 Tax=Brassica carinata TaxID=52824 RepID=A0A8X7WMF8_BRACI|nr:hypothetical protein Bca52824_001913 [Brassica carinata]